MSRAGVLASVLCVFCASACLASIPSDWASAYASADLLYYDPSSQTATESGTAKDGGENGVLNPSVGNGFFATVIDSGVLYVANVYNGPSQGPTPSHAAQIPAPFTTLSLTSGPKMAAEALDVRNAAFYKRYAVAGLPSNAYVQESWVAHRVLKHVMVYTVQIVQVDHHHQTAGPLDGLSVNVCFQQNSVSWTSPDFQFVPIQSSSPPLPTNTTLVIGQTLVPELDGMPVNTLVFLMDDLPACVSLSDASPRRDFLWIVDFSVESALQWYKNASSMDHVSRWNSHVEAWSHLWSASVDILGNLESTVSLADSASSLALAQTINSSYYYLFTSLDPQLPHSISPGTLASNGYNQHVFWDACTWMLPPIAVFHPSIAAMMLQYHVDRIPQAIQKARSYPQGGYKGAMFPWESAQTGAETCPSWAPTGQQEQHISGDIVVAAEFVYWLTRQPDFQFGIACPLATNIAEFWASRVEYGASDGQYHINVVIPPDEYAVGVNDSVYTNVAAAKSLVFAQTVCAAASSDTNVRLYGDVASQMFVPYDSVNDRHPEFAGYSGQTVKQADVVLLGFPLDYAMNASTRRNDLDYYSARTDSSGPAMTWGAFAIGHLELQSPTLAFPFFLRSYANAHAPYFVWTETPTGGTTNFATGMGGFLQTMVFGWAGMRVRSDGVHFKAYIPDNVPQGFRLRNIKLWDNSAIDVTVLRQYSGIANVACVQCSASSVCVKTDQGQTVRLKPLSETTAARVGGEFLVFPC
eukprot:ANDGO_05456.mRNA.1 Acid trehalase-like protein 1